MYTENAKHTVNCYNMPKLSFDVRCSFGKYVVWSFLSVNDYQTHDHCMSNLIP